MAALDTFTLWELAHEYNSGLIVSFVVEFETIREKRLTVQIKCKRLFSVELLHRE